MGWVNWLKGLAGGAPARPEHRATAAPRRPRKGGEAYAREWVKVLEDTQPGARDPHGTYTWELHPEDLPPAPAPAPAPRRAPAPAPAARSTRPADAFDTYTWEVQETDDRNDPWGLKNAEPPRPQQQDGVNPYDTGIFKPHWTGRFDQR